MLTTEALMTALTRRSLAGEDTTGQDRARERIESHSAVIGKLQRRRHGFSSQLADMEEGELGDYVRGQIKDIGRQITEHEKERDQLQSKLGAMEDAAQVQRVLARVPGGVSIDMGMAVESSASREATIRELHDRWARTVSRAAWKTTVVERRAGLRDRARRV